MKYKVGDKVKVREDLENNVFYGGTRANEDMIKHRGKILTIRGIEGGNYLMEEENWCWTDEMLEDVEEEISLKDFLNILWKNPEIIINKFSNMYKECQKINEDLKVELKNKQSEIDFLKGQLSVYEKFLKCKEGIKQYFENKVKE